MFPIPSNHVNDRAATDLLPVETGNILHVHRCDIPQEFFSRITVETFHTRTRHFLGQVAERRIIVIDTVHQRLLDRLHPFRLQRHFPDQRIQYAQRIQRLVALSGQHRRKRSGSPFMCMVRQLVTTACPVCKRTEFPYFLKHQR